MCFQTYDLTSAHILVEAVMASGVVNGEVMVVSSSSNWVHWDDHLGVQECENVGESLLQQEVEIGGSLATWHVKERDCDQMEIWSVFYVNCQW